MLQTIQTNRTLLVDGPASVQLVSGKAAVFGKSIKESQKIVIREGKRMPFLVVETSVFQVLLGANASALEVEGSTVPESWNDSVQDVLKIQKKPKVILVLGAIDSGKSSFCTFMVNRLVEGNHKVAVLDGDLGQSDIGPSASIGFAVVTKPVSELYNLRLQNGYFVGVTSPIMAVNNTIEGITCMMQEAYTRQVDAIVVNTDGFITGHSAFNYKVALVEAIKPEIIFGVQVQNELEALFTNFPQHKCKFVEPSSSLRQRTAEKRKSLREMTYAKYLKKAKLQCYPLSQICVEPKNGVPKIQEPERGVLVGLYGRGSKFLGIGVLRAVNSGRRILKVQTSVSTKPLRLVFGKVLVNLKLQEIQN